MVMDDLTLEQMNWELSMVSLEDAIRHLQECRERLEKALGNIGELRDA